MARNVQFCCRIRPLIPALIACALIASAPAGAQTRDDYAHLIKEYADGRAQEAVSALNRWPIERIIDVGTQPFLSDPRALIMLHTETAAALINIDGQRATVHLDIARRHLATFAGHISQDARAMAFVRHWWDFAPTIYLLAGDTKTVFAYVHFGLIATPGTHPLLYFYRGVAMEAQAYRGTQSIITGGVTFRNTDQFLRNAASIYVQALSADEHLACARLHLGWVHFQQRDSRARKDIETALADAGDDEATRYLAHLFLGAIDEREKRLADAQRQYEEAKVVNPLYQTSYMALMRVAEARGDTPRARQEAAAFAAVDKLDDPWWNYTGGFNLPVLEWLRADSRSR